MTDIHTSVPGVRGHTRNTWRDETHLRGVLLRLKHEHPDATREELQVLYLTKVRRLSNLRTLAPLIEEALNYKFDNDWARVQQPASRPHRAPPAVVATGADRVRSVVLLDLVLPNGKKLRECSGAECRAAGGWLVAVADRVGDAAVVGATLNEAAVAGIWAGQQQPAPRRRRTR